MPANTFHGAFPPEVVLATAYGYLDAGWAELTTLPASSKSPPDKGTTGRRTHVVLNRSDLFDKIHNDRRTNLGLVMPDGIIGIDVDNYGDKEGAKTMAELAERLGDLPPTYSSSSRDDGVSGIYLYRHPLADRAAVFHDPAGVEIISPGYRCAVVGPSVHPEGRCYRWLFNRQPIEQIPLVSQVPLLPDGWFDELTKDPRSATNAGSVYDECTDPTTTTSHLDRFHEALADGGASHSRHGAMLKLTGHLIAKGQDAFLPTVRNAYAAAFRHPELNRRLAAFDDAVNRARSKGFAPSKDHGAASPSVGFHLRTADDFEAASVDWLEPDQFPIGFLGVLAGIGGLGKSTYTADLASRLTTGTTTGTHAGQPMRVLFCSAEDTVSQVIKPRLMAAEADLSRVHFITTEPDSDIQQPFEIPNDLDLIEQAVRGLDDLALIVIDPIVAFLGDATDTHRDKDTRRALAPLSAMADRLGVHILAVMHLNKGTGTSLFVRLSSSGAFYNAVRFAVLFGENPDDPRGDTRILATGKSNFGPLPASQTFRIEEATVTDRKGNPVRTSRCVDIGASQYSADDLLAARTGHESQTKTETAMELVEEIWMKHSGGAPVAAFEQRLSEYNELQPNKEDRISMDTLRRAYKRLGGTKRRRGFGKDGGWEWIPPDGYFDQFPTST